MIRRRNGYQWGSLAVTALVVVGPVATLAHQHFTVHMIQHLLLTLVAAPLLAMGAPITALLKATSGDTRRVVARVAGSRPVHLLTHPLVTWSAFALVMWVTHFSPLYDAALENELVHVLEHALFFGAAFLFWTPVIASDPISKRKLAWPARLGYLAAALPLQSFLGLAIYSAERPLYEAYPDLDDQRLGALVMWLGGDLVFVGAIALTIGAWMRADRREATRLPA